MLVLFLEVKILSSNYFLEVKILSKVNIIFQRSKFEFKLFFRDENIE